MWCWPTTLAANAATALPFCVLHAHVTSAYKYLTVMSHVSRYAMDLASDFRPTGVFNLFAACGKFVTKEFSVSPRPGWSLHYEHPMRLSRLTDAALHAQISKTGINFSLLCLISVFLALYCCGVSQAAVKCAEDGSPTGSTLQVVCHVGPHPSQLRGRAALFYALKLCLAVRASVHN